MVEDLEISFDQIFTDSCTDSRVGSPELQGSMLT